MRATTAFRYPKRASAYAELARLGVTRSIVASGAERLAAITDRARRLAIACSYPDWLVARLLDELGEGRAEAFLRASNHRAPLIVRANRLKNDREQLLAALAEESVPASAVPLAPDALELKSHVNAYALAAFKDGRFELQDSASQLIGEVVAPAARERVLDFCAGAGGKTLHLGALLQGGGRIVACDVMSDKLEELRRRARRAGLSNVEAHRITEAGALPAAVGNDYDRVLCDAPCTGSGVLRRNAEARWRIGPQDLVALPARQVQILERVAPLVAVGGRLIYATCSILRVENDEVVDRFLESHAGFEPVPVKEILGTDRALAIGDGLRLCTAPDTHDSDGFFAAVMRRRA